MKSLQVSSQITTQQQQKSLNAKNFIDLYCCFEITFNND